MRCPACQAENQAQNKFCGECGARLPLTCPGCGHPNEPTQKFCGECGTRLLPATTPAADSRAGAARAPAQPMKEAAPPAAIVPPPAAASPAFRDAAPVTYTPKHLAEKILTSKGALEGERKTVTVMFSDVSGFTAMSERLDPEDVHGIMDRVFEVILAAVHRCEGTINQFLGDGVMALFGAPIAHEDHAPRALSAALAIQEGLKPLAADIKRVHGLDFQHAHRDQHRSRGGGRDRTRPAHGLHRGGRHHQSRRPAPQHRQAGPDRRQSADPAPPRSGVHLRGSRRLPGEGKERAGPRLRAHGRDAGRRQARGLHGALAEPAGGARPRAAPCSRGLSGARRRARGRSSCCPGSRGSASRACSTNSCDDLDGTDVLELETTCVSYGRSIPYRPILELLRRYLDLARPRRPRTCAATSPSGSRSSMCRARRR